MSEQLPYEVQTWFHGRKMRRKSYIPRSALLEVLTGRLCYDAKRRYVRRGRIKMADLERELEERRNFAKAVSGFANSDGGLIVWGIDARPNSDGT